jgi:hypothetical protein
LIEHFAVPVEKRFILVALEEALISIIPHRGRSELTFLVNARVAVALAPVAPYVLGVLMRA